MKELSWKHVTVILGFFGAVVVLAVTGNETGSLILVGMAVLGGAGLIASQNSGTKEVVNTVKDQTNGRLTEMLAILERQGQMMAAMQPPPVALEPFAPVGTSGASDSAH